MEIYSLLVKSKKIIAVIIFVMVRPKFIGAISLFIGDKTRVYFNVAALQI